MSGGTSTSQRRWAKLRTNSHQKTVGSTRAWSGVSLKDLKEFIADAEMVGLDDSVQVRFRQESSTAAFSCWSVEAEQITDTTPEAEKV